MNIQKVSIKKINPASYNPRKDLKPDDIEYKHIAKSRWCGIGERAILSAATND
jgi:hypothetical protein